MPSLATSLRASSATWLLIWEVEPRTQISVSVLFVLTFGLLAQAFGSPLPDPYDRHKILGIEPGTIIWQRTDEVPKRAASYYNFDVISYELDLYPSHTEAYIEGSVKMLAESVVDTLSMFVIDLFNNMTVDSVKSGSSHLSYTHGGDEIRGSLGQTYTTGQTFEVTIWYHGYPDDGGFGAYALSYHNSWPIVSTLSEPDYARAWWPCKDIPADKADSVDIYITVDDALVAGSNGTLMSVTSNGGTDTYHWDEDYPIPTYLVSLAITNYDLITDWYHYAPGESMIVTHYVYPEDYSDALEDLNVTVPMIECYAGLFDEYPFVEEKYGHAEFTWGGAMEHTTLTSYGAVLIRGDHYYDWICGHELAHQWWGDCVTLESWPNIWLNEGFASYSEALWFEHIGGFSAYQDYVDGYDSYGYFNGPLYDPDQLFGRTVYDKGALVLHMLRHVVGDSVFFDILTTYRATYDHSTANTAQLQAVCESVYGHSLDWYFQEWVYGIKRPDYQWSWMSYQMPSGDYAVIVQIDQVQTNTGLFKMPIDIVVNVPGPDYTFTVWDSLESQTFHLEVPVSPSDVDFDPDNWVLKYLTEVAFTGVAGPLEAETIFGFLPTYPNPAAGPQMISFALDREMRATVTVHDVAGRLISTVVDEELDVGVHSYRWDGTSSAGEDVASGIYFAKLKAGTKSATEKLVIAR